MSEPTHIQGMQNTLNIEQSQRIPDVDDKIYILEPIETPLTAFLTQIGKIGDGGGKFKGSSLLKRTVYNPEFTEFEDKYSGVWAKVNLVAGYDTDDTEIVVDTPGAAIFSKYDMVKNIRTGEIYRVTSVNYDTNTLTITRAQGSVSAAAINNDDDLHIIGNAYEEGSKSGTSNATKLVKVTNYTQIFKTKFGVTRTQDKSRNYPLNAGDTLKYQRAKQAVEHAKKIERAYLWGEKEEKTGPDGKPLRYTGGIYEALVAAGNVQDQNGSALDSTDWKAFLQDYAFQYGSKEKYLFCGNIILGSLESFYSSQMVYTPNDKTFGVDIRRLMSPFGILNIVNHPMFEGAYAGDGVVLDLSTLKHCPLNGSDTELKTNIQDNDADGEEDQYLTECGLQRVNFEKNALIMGAV